MGLFGDSRRLAIPDNQNMAKCRQVWRTKEKSIVLYRKGETPLLYRSREGLFRGQNVIGGKWALEVVATSHWLQAKTACCHQARGSLSPAGLCRAARVQGWALFFMGSGLQVEWGFACSFPRQHQWWALLMACALHRLYWGGILLFWCSNVS